MADAIPPIKVSIVADTSGLKTGVDQATKGIKDLDDNVKTASNGMSSFVSKIKTVGATLGVAFAGQQVLQFGKDVILASSNMAESLSKVQVVFGQNANAVEKWGNTSASAMGISKQAALEAAGTYGNLFQAFGLGQGEATKMSTSLVQLASDMASFNNTSIDDAILALRSGLSGETEPLKRFGVALNEVRLKEEAMSLGLIKSTKEALTPAAKAQAAYALILHDTKLAQGDYGRTADGTANTMRTLAAEFENAKVALGDALMPAFRAILGVLKLLVPVLTAIGEFFKKYQAELIAFGKAIMAGVAAFTAYKTILLLTTTATKAFGVIQVLLKGQQLATIASTNGLAASMLKLNAVMRANVIGIVVTAVAALIGLMVHLYQHNMKVRNAMLDLGIAGIKAFAFLLEWTGKLAQGMLKIATGPLKVLLQGLAFLKVPGAKEALNGLNTAIDGVGKFFESAAKKVESYTIKLEQAKRATTTFGQQTKDAVSDANKGGAGGGKGGGLTAEQKSKLDGYVKKAKDIQKDMQDVIDAANEKALDALNTRNEKMAEANANYLEREKELRKNYDEAIAEAEKTYGERKLDINKTYDAKETDLLKTKIAKEKELQDRAQEQTTNLIKAAAEKRQSIIQQSIDRLRDAFASKTGFDIAEAFGSGATGKDLLAKLKKNLDNAKALQTNAGKLAAAGYSQTFIEQIVKQGPEVGNQIAKALQESTPEETKALQASFAEMEKVQNSGLDSLAASMNSGARLATDELRKAYEQVSVDLVEALKVVDDELKKSMAEANANYQEAMAETKIDRDEALAEALKTFEEAKAKAQKILNEGLAEAQKTLQDALIKAQKEYEKAIDEINKATAAKIEDLKAKLAEVIALIAAISAANAALVAAQTPTYTPVVPTTPPTTTTPSGTSNTTNYNTNINGYNLSDPNATASSVQYYIKYGQVVEIPSGTNISNQFKGMQTVFE